MLRNIFFDFDGVIAESVQAKTDAFKDLYLEFGNEVTKKVVEHHLNHGGVSRFEKFRIYHRDFLGIDLSAKEIEVLAGRFSQLVLQKVINADEVPGVGEFLKKYHKQLNFWIITGTPTNEIDVIIKKRKLGTFFKGWYGSPENKIYWCDLLLNKYNLDRNETIFLGDASTDLKAARHSNIHFALRETGDNQFLFKDFKGIRFENFFELEKQLNLKN